jgi:hypothetical protein
VVAQNGGSVIEQLKFSHVGPLKFSAHTHTHAIGSKFCVSEQVVSVLQVVVLPSGVVVVVKIAVEVVEIVEEDVENVLDRLVLACEDKVVMLDEVGIKLVVLFDVKSLNVV